MVGAFRIEKNKSMTQKLLCVNHNRLNIITENVEIKQFENEYDLTDIHNYIRENNDLILKAEFAGSGKTYAITEYDKDTLFIMPNNLQCAEKRKDGFKSMTFHKFFGINITGMENKKFKGYNTDDIHTICFDEIYMYEPYLLKRIALFSLEHPDIKIIATGDMYQLKPINFTNTNYVNK